MSDVGVVCLGCSCIGGKRCDARWLVVVRARVLVVATRLVVKGTCAGGNQGPVTLPHRYARLELVAPVVPDRRTNHHRTRQNETRKSNQEMYAQSSNLQTTIPNLQNAINPQFAKRDQSLA